MSDTFQGGRISFNCSNLVAAQAGYRPQNEWGECVAAVNAFYSPLATFPARFEQMLVHIRALGFDALDIWTPGQLNWRWATSGHIDAARELLAHHRLSVTSLGGDFGETRDEFLAACRLAVGLGVDLLSGGCPLYFQERGFVLDALDRHNLRLSLENEPESSPAVMESEMGTDRPDRIGTTVDTGWYVTQAYDPARAIRELGARIWHVHLKDVLRGKEHVNVGYGQGNVPLEACVAALQAIGYAGDYSVENHALDHDPTAEIAAGRLALQTWLAKSPTS